MACWLEWWVLVLQLIGRSNNVRPVLHRIAFHWWGWRPAASYSRPAMCKEDAFYWIWAIISSRFLKLYYDCSVREGENDVRICHWEFVSLLPKKEAFAVESTVVTHNHLHQWLVFVCLDSFCVPCQPCLYWCLYILYWIAFRGCGPLGVDGSLGGQFVRRWSDSTALGTGRALSLDNVLVNQFECPLQVAKWKVHWHVYYFIIQIN